MPSLQRSITFLQAATHLTSCEAFHLIKAIHFLLKLTSAHFLSTSFSPYLRLSSPRNFKYPNPSQIIVVPDVTDLPVAVYNHNTQGDGYFIRGAWSHKETPGRSSDQVHDRSDSVLKELLAGKRGSRSRRHANGGGRRSHGHLMRVGCVLGTCQVQNLSHRLYQLIGQSGKEDSSPINPRSPHSYG